MKGSIRRRKREGDGGLPTAGREKKKNKAGKWNLRDGGLPTERRKKKKPGK